LEVVEYCISFDNSIQQCCLSCFGVSRAQQMELTCDGLGVALAIYWLLPVVVLLAVASCS
jgi:hypothetical protein